MIVPNYVPEPLEVPNNIAEAPYAFRLRFIRRVMFLHLGTVGGIVLLTGNAWPQSGVVGVGLAFILVVIGLDFWRIAARSSRSEGIVSAGFLPVVVALASWLAVELQRIGFPVWAPLTGLLGACLYALLCGRDFSFAGCFLLSWILSSVAIAWRIIHLGLPVTQAAVALASNTAYLSYYLYDLASLLARRRKGEEWAATVDLYRDIFNVFGFVVRCVRHWRKHRIWEIAR